MADKPYRDLATITKVVLAALVVLCLVEAAKLVGLVMQHGLLVSLRDHTLSGDFMQKARANDARQQVLAVLNLVTLLTAIVLFLRWVYRAMSNVHALGATDTESPGWSVGSFFVPFVNFVVPYTAMSQIWRASASAGHWQDETAPIVGVWWALWLIVALGGYVVGFVLIGERGVAPLILHTRAEMAYTLLEIARNVVMMVLVTGVRARQDAQWRVADSFGGAPVTPF